MKKATLGALVLLGAVSLSACSLGNSGERQVENSRNASPSAQPEPGKDIDAENTITEADLDSAELVLTDFFSVKHGAGASINDRVTSQEQYLISREVHPTDAYASDEQLGVEDLDLDLTLSEPQAVGDTIEIEFKSLVTSNNYSIVGGEIDVKSAQPGWSKWEGVATLKEARGQWLISNLTIDAVGGGVGETPPA